MLGGNVDVQYRGTSGTFTQVPRRIERIVPKSVTRTEGRELVRRPEGADVMALITAMRTASAVAPSLRMEYGEARVNASEADAADAEIAKTGSSFRFEQVKFNARDTGRRNNEVRNEQDDETGLRAVTNAAADGGQAIDGREVKQGAVGADELDGQGARGVAAQYDASRVGGVHKLLDVNGRGFTGFFSNVSAGLKGRPDMSDYVPVLNTSAIQPFIGEYLRPKTPPRPTRLKTRQKRTRPQNVYRKQPNLYRSTLSRMPKSFRAKSRHGPRQASPQPAARCRCTRPHPCRSSARCAAQGSRADRAGCGAGL
jgi:hypothetical protein